MLLAIGARRGPVSLWANYRSGIYAADQTLLQPSKQELPQDHGDVVRAEARSSMDAAEFTVFEGTAPAHCSAVHTRSVGVGMTADVGSLKAMKLNP